MEHNNNTNNKAVSAEAKPSATQKKSRVPPPLPPGGPLKLVIPEDPAITEQQQEIAEVARTPHAQKVSACLAQLRLDQYFPALIENGYDDIRSLYCLTEDDLLSMDFELHHAQRLLQWSKANATPSTSGPGISPRYDSPDTADGGLSREWSYKRPHRDSSPAAGQVTPTVETFVHSPYTFFPYAAVSPKPTDPDSGEGSPLSAH
jgi:hypothetical protein